MTFPLAQWIDAHADCRHNLAKSGMIGSIPGPRPSNAEVRAADDVELRRRIADDLGVDPRRVFLTTGASAANALAVLFLARARKGVSRGAFRVCHPEYPPLFDTARWAGFRVTESASRTELAIVSQPRNPEGDLWERSRLPEWAAESRSLLVDEEFREFAGTRSVLGAGRPGLGATGSVTKFYGGDDLRLGWVVAPEERAIEFARFHGLVTNELSAYSVAGALQALDNRENTRRRVREILRANLAAARAELPRFRAPQAPLFFDRPDSREDGESLAHRALGESVLVCPGSFFGDPSGIRVCMTRRSFPADLRAYLRVRDEGTTGGRAAPRRPGGTGRAKGAPS